MILRLCERAAVKRSVCDGALRACVQPGTDRTHSNASCFTFIMHNTYKDFGFTHEMDSGPASRLVCTDYSRCTPDGAKRRCRQTRQLARPPKGTQTTSFDAAVA